MKIEINIVTLVEMYFIYEMRCCELILDCTF